MNIFVFTIVRLIFNLLASSKLISFPLLWLRFVITGTSFLWGGGCLGWEAPRPSWHHCNHDFTRIMYCKVIVIGNLYSWKEVQVQGTCSVSSEDREDLPLIAFKLKWEQGAAVSHLGEWGTLACCCKPSPLWWCSLPDVAAGVRDMPQHCIVMGRGTWDPGTPLAGDPLLSLGSAAVDCWQWQAMEGPSALPWKQSDGKFLGAWQAGWLRASLWPQPLADAAEKAVADKVRSSWDHDQSPWGAVSVFDHCSELAGGVTHQECVWSLLKSWVHLYSTGLLIKSHMWS